MAYTTTANLTLKKPTPGTREPVDITLLNANFDTLDAAVTLTGAQTLTNKTLTSPIIGTKLSFADAASKIVPGATSLSFRNNADNADNVIVSDAGDLTIRNDHLAFATSTLHHRARQIAALANLGTAQLAWAANVQALAFIVCQDDGHAAIYHLAGAANLVYELADPAATFTATAGTAASNNVYWSAGNARYEIENRRGGVRTYDVWFMAIA
jgi:hypothetical protein